MSKDMEGIWRGCIGKKRYETYAQALEVRAQCQSHRPDQPLRVYHCWRCGGHHLAKQLNDRGAHERCATCLEMFETEYRGQWQCTRCAEGDGPAAA